MPDFGKYWGHRRGLGIKFVHNGWNIEIGSFEFTKPEEFFGMTSYQYRMSRNDIVPGVWTDKNDRARLFDRRYFTSIEEAKEAAIKEASK